MMETLCMKTFLLTDLNLFDASTRTTLQDSSLHTTCITYTTDSLPTSRPAKTCNDPTGVVISVRISVTTSLPAASVIPQLFQNSYVPDFSQVRSMENFNKISMYENCFQQYNNF